ncbi:MAG TPA: G1 family glutamic endopeptidase [Candidatus Saccharimonadales bacterium]
MRKSFFAVSLTLIALVMLADAGLKLAARSISGAAAGNFDINPGSIIRPAVTTVSSTSGSKVQTAAAVSEVTRNWAGYISAGAGTYSGVSGTWTVPDISAGDSGLSADAAWIGIGGSSSDDLIQIGTENMIQDGQLTTAAFYEELPDISRNITSVTVNPGDTMSAAITQTSPGEWTVAIKDLTNGGSFSQPVAYDSSESSAEWIEEAPSDQTGIIPLDNFGTISFGNAAAVANGQAVSLAASGAEVVGMDNQVGESLASVSTLDGNSFTVARTGADNSSTPAPANPNTPAGGGFPTGRWYNHRNPSGTTSYHSYYPGFRHM